MIDETYSEEIWIAWFAGWFEGEGSISVTQPKKFGGVYLKLSGGTTDEDIARVLVRFGGNIHGPFETKTPSGNTGKPMWYWQLTKTNEVKDLVEKILPFLSERRTSQVNVALEKQRWAQMPTEEERFRSKLTPSGNCLIWNGGLDRYGFGSLCLDGGSKRKQAHRYAFELEGLHVPVKLKNVCGDKKCVRPEHWVDIKLYATALDES